MRTGEELKAAMNEISASTTHYTGPWPVSPWAVTAAGREWAITTDGHVMVAVPRELVPGDCLGPPEAVGKHTDKYLRLVPGAPVRVRAGELQAFAGTIRATVTCERCKGVRTVTCNDCDGDGSSECECHCGDVHTHECDKCDGDGEMRCPDCVGNLNASPALLLSGVINRELLQRVLLVIQPAADDEIDISLEPTSGGCFLFSPASNAWRALIIAMVNSVPTTAIFEKPETWQRPTAAEVATR